jgi:HEAT repeat protein
MSELVTLGPEAAPYLASVLGTLDEKTLAYVATALSQINNKEIVPALLRYLGTRNPDLRRQVVLLIGALGDATAAEALYPILKEEDPTLRSAAIGAVSSLNATGALERLGPLSRDPDGRVRSQALISLAVVADRQNLKDHLIEILRRGLEECQGQVKADLVVALARTGRRDQWSSIERTLGDESAEVRAAAAASAALLVVPESSEAVLRRIIVEQQNRVRLPLAVAAQNLKLENAIEPLIAWLSEQDDALRNTVAASLRILTGKDFGTARDKWHAWWAEERSKK